MKLFPWFKKSTPDTQVSNELIVANNADVDKDLFIDEVPPQQIETSREQTRLEAFLNANYESIGINDGYLMHSADALESKLRSLASKFRLIVDQHIDSKRMQIVQIKMDLQRVRGVSERLEKELEEKVSAIEQTVIELKEQKQLSIESEGYIAWVINGYRDGYLKGMQQYYSENALGINTGLF